MLSVNAHGLAILLILAQAVFFLLFFKSERVKAWADVICCGLLGAFIHFLLLQLGRVSASEWEIISASVLVLSFAFIGWSISRFDERHAGLGTRSENSGRDVIPQQGINFHDERLKTLGLFSATFVHEINQPLSVLLLKVQDTQRALHESNANAMSKGLSGIEKQLQHVLSLTQTLRSFSASDVHIEGGFVPVRQIFEDVYELCEMWIRSLDVRLIWPNEFPEIEVSGGRVLHTQILINLIKNSADALGELPKETERWIKVEINEHGGSVEFAVSNNGSALIGATRKHLFKAFFSTKKPGRGVGLGLAISKELVESVGGEIKYDDFSATPRFVVRYSYLPSVNIERKEHPVNDSFKPLKDVA